MKQQKTGVMRILDKNKIHYNVFFCETAEGLSGVEIAKLQGHNEAKVFKTLVTRGKSGEYYVFMVPVAEELDLRKAAKAAGEKNIAMIKSKELLGLTGYVHGGCSPIGMKKEFKAFIDESALDFDTIIFSAGKIGHQVEVSLEDLRKIREVKAVALIVDR